MDRARALTNTSDTTPDAAGGPPSCAEPWEEEEESSLQEDVTAPGDNAEPSAERGAGDSPEVAPPLRKVRIVLGAGEQLCLAALSCEGRRLGWLPQTPLATSGSCCLASSTRSSLCLLMLCQGETTNYTSQLRLCAPAEQVLNIKHTQFSRVPCISLAGLVPPLPGRSLLTPCSRKMSELAAVEEVTKSFSLTMKKQTLCSLFFFFFNRKGRRVNQRNTRLSLGNWTLCLLKPQPQLKPQSCLARLLFLKKSNPPAVRELMDLLLPVETQLKATGTWHTWGRKLAAWQERG